MSPTQDQPVFDPPDWSERIHLLSDTGIVLIDGSTLQQQVERLQKTLDELRLLERIQREKLHHLEDQLTRARDIQRNFLPEKLPAIHNADLHVIHRPLDELSGDCYDVIRLDEHRIAFSLADATDHGIPAALLSAYVQRSLRGLEWQHLQRCPLQPEEVLRRINADLLDARLQDCQSVAALYGVYDERTRMVRWARGGVPYPILIRKGQQPTEVVSEGPILGITSEPRFEITEIRLESGDRLVFHTDGLEALLLDPLSRLDQAGLTSTTWIRSLADQPIEHQLARLKQMAEQVDADSWKADDLTVMVLQMHLHPIV